MITFYSNFINEHQIPFCDAMYKLTNGNFCFVATEKISDERVKMGFVDKSDAFPYVIKSYESEDKESKAIQLGIESDVVIIGSAPDKFIKARLEQNKLTFRYSERFFKRGKWRIFDPRVFKDHFLGDFRYRKKNLYMLCASAYTASDCRFIFSYPKKTYRWGYFPFVKQYNDLDKIINLKSPGSILWVGRLVKIKHPEDAVFTAKKLKDNGVPFHLTIVGDGELKEYLKNLIAKNNLEDCVKIENFMPPEKVREKMENADIFLFTSDQNEGWGAVLSESMNSACAVVANNQIGSVPYLIKDGENALIYHRNRKNQLYLKTKYLLENTQEKRRIQKNAYQTMIETWNADNAAQRLLCLIDSIKNHQKTEFFDGPCSEDF